ncbi:MAG: hypothetical protein KKA90_01705 [Nanoarchaeota archaeon]|nr:hypothetical protein [Nanoarchaeota archaeon]
MRHGQATVEFLMIFMLFLAALNVVAVVAYQRYTEIQTIRQDIEANTLVVSLANTLNSAFLAGDGFRINMSLPNSVGNTNYTIHVLGNLLMLNTSRDTYSETLFTPNITGTFVPGLNTIRNINNNVVVQ